MTNEKARKTALVTGGARRIGRAIVRDLAAHGWTVAIHCNSSLSEGRSEAQAICEAGGKAIVVQADLQDAAAVAGLLPKVGDEAGPVSLLVNNASVFLEDSIGSLDPETWQRQFSVNLQAPVFLAEAFAAQLPDGIEGNIVNIVDQRVWKLTPQMTSYTLTKSALWTATRTLAQALAPRIRVNAIGPGPTFPNDRDGDAGLDREAAGTLLGRRIEPAEIAQAVRYIAETRSLTGQMLALDGGQHLAWQTPDIVDHDD
jgi:NAD(P)-dependent dehydrogenase (short-subunit alcohol dehydrogenase family)